MRELNAQPLDQIPDARAPVTDAAAIERIHAGETVAYEIIMRRYNQRLFRVARSILLDDDAAQDAVQEAYVSAWFKLDRYAPTGSFGAWLTRIAVNEALMIKRKDRQQKHGGEADRQYNGKPAQEQPAPRADPADRVANRELARLIENAVDALPDDFRSVFVLRAIQQLNVKETAVSLGVNEATVKTRFHRARNLMQEALNNHIASAGMRVFEFAGSRCDRMVMNVFRRLAALVRQGE